MHQSSRKMEFFFKGELKRLVKRKEDLQNQESKEREILAQKIQKRKMKLLAEQRNIYGEKLLITNWNTFYRKVALNLKDMEKIFQLDGFYRITPRSFI